MKRLEDVIDKKLDEAISVNMIALRTAKALVREAIDECLVNGVPNALSEAEIVPLAACLMNMAANPGLQCATHATDLGHVVKVSRDIGGLWFRRVARKDVDGGT